MTDTTPLERLVRSGAFEVDQHGMFVVDSERGVRFDTARLVLAYQRDPTFLDDIAAVFGAEAAQDISALIAQATDPGSWISHWWRLGATLAVAVVIVGGIWLASGHLPVLYILRVLWKLIL